MLLMVKNSTVYLELSVYIIVQFPLKEHEFKILPETESTILRYAAGAILHSNI